MRFAVEIMLFFGLAVWTEATFAAPVPVARFSGFVQTGGTPFGPPTSTLSVSSFGTVSSATSEPGVTALAAGTIGGR